MKPLTEIPSGRLHVRCAQLLHVPPENVNITSIARQDMLGTFVAPEYFIGSRDFRITATQYHDPQCKIPFPRPQSRDLSQPEIDELFTTTRVEQILNDRAKRNRRRGLAVLLAAIVVTAGFLVYLFWLFNR